MKPVIQSMKVFLNRILIFIVVIGIGYGFVAFYPYIFSKKIKGTVVGVDHIPINVAVINGNQQGLTPQVFSFSVAIQDPNSSEILTASSEDRQWAVVKPGQCAVAEFFPYPPWNLKKQGTYMNARLIQLYGNCEDAKQ